MKSPLALLSCCVILGAPLHFASAQEKSVIRVVSSVTYPDATRPWAKGQSIEYSGSGVIIDGKRILTNAHLLMYATEVYVQTRLGDDKFEAKVQALGPDIDLAVLTVKDEKFFQNRPALARSEKLPKVADAVAVLGFPIGGSDLAVTKGEISRIGFGGYGHRGLGIHIQVSAAVNPGNSGGPAVVNGRMIGIVQSRIANAQNIGSVVPNEEIELFLEDIKDGRYDGKPMDDVEANYQPLENETLRRMFKVDPKVQGVLALPPERAGTAYPLKPFDIVTKIGSHSISNTGMIELENGLRVPFPYLVPKLARENRVLLTVMRGGKHLDVFLPVSSRDNRLIPSYQGDPLPYFIHGPLVFSVARAEDIPAYGQMNLTLFGDNSPLVTRRFESIRFPGEELVVVSAPMFTHKIAKGYANPVAKTVREVNGVQIKNLRHLVETLRDCADEYVKLRFVDQYSEVLVFDRNDMERATEAILEDNGIAPTRRGSPEMLKVWNAKAGSKR